MSLRLGYSVHGLAAALALAAACAGCASGSTEADGPQTAREKQYAEAKQNGELDDQKPVKKGGWQFKGDRNDCRYLVASTSKCFKSKKAACTAAGCGASCTATGAGPATISCKK
ncbi:MAG: hypothetical protein ABI467_25480 [Kofleriaceae bacterium]